MALNVVFFNRSFYPDITATGQLLAELCEGLARDYGCRVTVIAGMPLRAKVTEVSGDNRGLLVRKENFSGVEVLRVRNTAFKTESFLGRILNYITYFLLSIAVSFGLKKPDIVVTLTDPPIIVLLGLAVAYRFRIPLVISVRDLFPEAAGGLEGAPNPMINFLLDSLNRFCLRRAAHIITLGKLMQQNLIEKKGVEEDKITIIPDWADCEQITPLPKENDFSIARGLHKYFVVMYAGNIGASSRLEFVVETARLLKVTPDILFVFNGEGIMKDKLVQLAAGYGLKNVQFFPYQPKEMLPFLFSSADIFIIPLKKGLSGFSLPSKIYSIMASGKPYIAAVENESEIAMITRVFDCGLLAQPQDAEDLARKILLFYQNKEMREKMGSHARNAALLFDRRLGIQKHFLLFKGLHTW